MEKKYLEFVKEFMEEKDLEKRRVLVDNIIKEDINFDLEMETITLVLEDLRDLDTLFDKSQPLVEYYMKRSIIFFNIIKKYTYINVDDCDTIENYNIQLEETLKQNVMIKRCFNIIETLYQKQQLQIIEDLTNSLKEIPSVEDVDKMTKDFQTLFGEENAENLQTLKDIAIFNDPSMKLIKEALYDTKFNSEQNIQTIIDKNNL